MFRKIAEKSAETIYKMFISYLLEGDFVGKRYSEEVFTHGLLITC